MDYKHYLNIARHAAQLAGENLLRLWNVPRDIQIKSDESLLTQVDTQNEEILSEFLTKATPDFGFLGEESGLHAAAHSSDPYWYVDPVDGTSNLAHRFPWTCISIALVIAGEPKVGVVYNPLHAQMFCAAEGLGSNLNDTPIHVSEHVDFERALLATGFPVGPSDSRIPNMLNFDRVSRQCHSVRRPGSAAIDCACVAAGWFDGFWEIGLKPWDTAAGCVLIREAGGVVSGFEGDAYDPHQPYIVAGNPEIHRILASLVYKKD